AMYGRSNRETCPHKSADEVAKRCNWKRNCSVPATNAVFGDPCPGTSKYLENNGPIVACDGSVAELHCGKIHLISVSRAMYGRSNRETCSSGRSPKEIENISCLGSADKVAQSCNGKENCSVQVTNKEFGDPCPGTYKYLVVDYTCQGKWRWKHFRVFKVILELLAKYSCPLNFSHFVTTTYCMYFNGLFCDRPIKLSSLLATGLMYRCI
uniref:SUEL-type lectin domain-containing protein n=1 Tax=Fundulus heteroclitus TaxID=8078 RepID=A0A3Q2NR74_FUNHE